MSEDGHMRYRISSSDTAAPEPPPAPIAPATRRFGWRQLVALGCWLYAAGLVLVAMLLWWAPVELWPMQLFVYLPRLVLGLPLLVLAPAAALAWRRRLLIPLAAAVVVFVGPVLGFTIPWRTLVSGGPPQMRVRVLTSNVDGNAYSPELLGALIAARRPDVILLQELSGKEPDFLPQTDAWNVRQGDGLLVASRFPIRRVTPIHGDSEARALALDVELDIQGRPFHVVNLHLETPRDGIEELEMEKLEGIAAFRQVAEIQRRESEQVTAAVKAIPGPLLVGGDFNLTADSPIYRRYWSGFGNAFSMAGLGFGYTRYEKHLVRARIDHVLGGPGWRPVWSWVGPHVGSDHLPVLADLEWIAPLPEPDLEPEPATEVAVATAAPADHPGGAGTEIPLPLPTDIPPPLPVQPPGVTTPPAPPASEPAPAPGPDEAHPPAMPEPAAPAAADRAPEAAPADPNRERLEFRQELQLTLDQFGNNAGPAIQDLCKRHGATAPPRAASEPTTSSFDRRGRIRLFRAQGVPEAAIVFDLAASEARMIGARKGPRSPAEALVRASRYVLSVPVE
jgi:endonuclease/exonuclease/phosphatase (EEP) superfamily protein YafD